MYVHMHACMHACMHARVCIYRHMPGHVRVYTCICMPMYESVYRGWILYCMVSFLIDENIIDECPLDV